MEIAHVQIRIFDEKEIQRRTAIIQEHNNCPLCGAEMKFSHDINSFFSKVVEDAECLSCSIKIKTSEHALH
ncbi:MAG: hypothetical protein AB7O96_04320 [Pseudobdellovibrionaceae bacterium]